MKKSIAALAIILTVAVCPSQAAPQDTPSYTDESVIGLFTGVLVTIAENQCTTPAGWSEDTGPCLHTMGQAVALDMLMRHRVGLERLNAPGPMSHLREAMADDIVSMLTAGGKSLNAYRHLYHIVRTELIDTAQLPAEFK